jgi:hypothetical protein
MVKPLHCGLPEVSCHKKSIRPQESNRNARERSPLMRGTVESISPAAAQEFQLLPAQNTSGNWVKVVQANPYARAR